MLLRVAFSLDGELAERVWDTEAYTLTLRVGPSLMDGWLRELGIRWLSKVALRDVRSQVQGGSESLGYEGLPR